MGFLCGYPNSCGVIRPPFQGSDVFAWQPQGAALGCDGSSRWDSKPQSSRTKNQEKPLFVTTATQSDAASPYPNAAPNAEPENGLKDRSVL